MEQSLLCFCGKSFTHSAAFTRHRKTCGRCKKRLSNALTKLKESNESKERKETPESPNISNDKLSENVLPDDPIAEVVATTEERPTKRRRKLPSRFRASSMEMHDRNLRGILLQPAPALDILPQPAPALPPPDIQVAGPTSVEVTQIQPPLPFPDDLHGSASCNQSTVLPCNLRKILETHGNSFGLFRRYFSQQFPSHDPEGEADISSLSNINLEHQTSVAYGPYPNHNSFRLGQWYWNDGIQKSQTSFKELLSIVGDDAFRPSDIRSTNWDKINEKLVDDKEEWEDEGAGWKTSTVTISVPFHRLMPNPGPKNYAFANFHHRSLMSVIREKLANESDIPYFHYEPYELLWRVSDEQDPVRVYGELYTSPAFLSAHNALQESPREPGCDLPRVVVALMFWSDATHLTTFGKAKLWPLYMFYGNESKHRRGKPTCNLCEHVAYFEMLPDSFKDFATTYTSGKKLKPQLLAHCHREFAHTQWAILLDDDFLSAYEHGAIIKSCDGKHRRFYPRIFTYSADYPEKILMAGIRNRGRCPCPRCTIPLTKTHLVGTKSDRNSRTTLARIDNDQRRGLISAARNVIYQQNHDVDSVAVERLLKPHSLVPTSNAFSDSLSQFGFNLFSLFVVDLMHEVELGVWKTLFIHLLRIVEAANENMLHELDRRFRLVPTFGKGTIRRFSSNTSDLKQMAARDYEDFLQCAIPVFEGLLPEPHNHKLLRLLFTFAHWHGLAKLRMHTDITLAILDDETTVLGKQLRDFQSSTCSAYITRELSREALARERRGSKTASSSNPQQGAQGRRLKTLNLQTYKFHSLGDYVSMIQHYGTTDSYTTATGELEHRNSKARYKRTSKKGFVQQLTKIERRKTRIRLLRQKLVKTSPCIAERVPRDPEVHHHIGVSERNRRHIPTFLQSHNGDPAITDFWAKLKSHLLPRIKTHNTSFSNSSNRADSASRLFFKNGYMYEHNIMRINYTTYDVRRSQDTINPNTEHRDVMLLSNEDLDMPCHQYLYARVLGIYHVNVIYTGSEPPDYSAHRMEFLWVRWFKNTNNVPVQRSWAKRHLDCFQLLPVLHKDAFGFVDPANVLRSIHLIPRFKEGKRHVNGKGISECAQDSKDWCQYYGGRFVDRDMLMRYHWGLAVGHAYSHFPSALHTDAGSSDSAETTDNTFMGDSCQGVDSKSDDTIHSDDDGNEEDPVEEDSDSWVNSSDESSFEDDSPDDQDVAFEEMYSN